jgi:hypothetical protein
MSTEAEVEAESEENVKEDEDGDDATEEKDDKSTKLDFTDVDTNDKLTAPSLPSSSSSVLGEGTRENEVGGVFDKISAFVWGIEDEKELELEEGETESEANVEEVEEESGGENERGSILVRNIEFTESTGL